MSLKFERKQAKISIDRCHDTDDNVISSSISTNSNCTNTADNSETIKEVENIQENNEFPTLTIRMLNFCREFAIFCLVMMAYAAFSKDPPKVSKSPAAYRFFPEDSIVVDWYKGQISKAIDHARSSDIVFVMFYAPWDADSQSARKEFEKAAEYMQDRVKFEAVNCWQPHGECRTQYNKVYKWPVLIAYMPHGRGIQYNGPISAPHIIQFLNRVCYPLKHLLAESFRDCQDAFVTVQLDTSPGSMDFAVLYTASLRYLEKDPQYRITFYVIPSKISTPHLQLHMWNETLIYPIYDKPWLPDEILQWIFKHAHQITSWILPSGSKSITLSNSLQNGPALILFTPRNPLLTNIDYYIMLQEIAQEYFMCEENLVSSARFLNLKIRRNANELIHEKLKATCNFNSKKLDQKLISQVKIAWSNASTCSQRVKPKECDLLIEDKLLHSCADIKTENCFDIFPILNKNPGCKDQYSKITKTSILDKIDDYKSPDNLRKIFIRDKCKEFLAAEKVSPAIFVRENTPSKNISIAGLSCRSNKSLTLLAMDSLLDYNYAERLGIDIFKQSYQSAVVILNEKMESHYILEQQITSDSIKEFILNFTKGELNRSLSSVSTISSATPEPIKLNKSTVFVQELNTNSFLPTVLKEDQCVVVFYYSKQCSFCNGISYVFLTVARKLSFMKNLIFARINGDTNILPWEYTMETYPTILFFPSNRKSESRVFPSGLSLSVPNLINFILTNFEPSQKLHALWPICVNTKFINEKSTCYSQLLRETLNLIDNTLRKWRKSEKLERQILLHRLKTLRHLYLLFAHSSEKYPIILNTLNRLHSNMKRSKDYYRINKTNIRHDEL